jgi:hypothetical protein
MLQTDAEELETGSTGTASTRFGHDFSQTPIHPPSARAEQTKLTINQPRDDHERAADHVAGQLMRMPELQLLRYPYLTECVEGLVFSGIQTVGSTHLPPAPYELTTFPTSASPPRWARSRR